MTTTRTPETADPTNPASLEDRTERAWKTVHRRGSFIHIMRKTLEHCRTQRAFSDMEREMATYTEFRYSDQSQASIIRMLVNAGALECGKDRTLRTTDAGAGAADRMRPSEQLRALFDEDPERQGAYTTIMELCRTPREYPDVEEAMRAFPSFTSHNELSGLPAFPSALLAKLEAAYGLVWDEGWTLTPEGAAFLNERTARTPREGADETEERRTA